MTAKKKVIKMKVSPMVRSLHASPVSVDRHQAKQNKPATILYKKLPDNMILITGFENFLSLDELFDKYGRVVAKAYSDYPYHVTASIGALFLSGSAPTHIATGQLFNKQEFSTIIAHIKKCGGLLHNIIAEVNKGQVKRIEI